MQHGSLEFQIEQYHRYARVRYRPTGVEVGAHTNQGRVLTLRDNGGHNSLASLAREIT